MWRKVSCAVGGLALACAAAYFVTSVGSSANTTSFDLRWMYPAPAAKADRLPIMGEQPASHIVMPFNIPSENTTIVAKGPVPRLIEQGAVEVPRSSSRQLPANPVREIPNEVSRKEKLPEGCEPSFSPVTTPALAHISGRCVS